MRRDERDPLTGAIIEAAIEVHRHLGPGLYEALYEACLAWELEQRGFTVERQVRVPVRYKGMEPELGYRLDLLVNGEVIVEVKAVERINTLVHAQVLTYLTLAGLRRGLIINFNVRRLKDGVTRLVR
ncbi:MAG: GxxExxY protein [Gemmatimonadaceae bacterium]|nr:GxxExxY protein [Gemmatimonadaceae bacterium]NUQ93818.1 GxxExxY protein [Gemmatimonadaceae bacterium]NUR19228.1 GxxExxY protein [Gemmatimonadaceae bacterium]NUS98403.1 GxxExxY protein [Gemmatimonadaceae bacterium]